MTARTAAHGSPAPGGASLSITFIIRQFTQGGAERQLVELVKHADRQQLDISIVCLYSGGALWEEVNSIPGLRVVSLEKTGRWDFGVVGRLWNFLRQTRPDIVHGYLDVSNVLALLAKPLGAKVVWGIRSSRLDMSPYELVRRMAWKVEGILAGLPDLIICNSSAGKANLAERGFPMSRVTVIPNGTDMERLKFDPTLRSKTRAEWSVAPTEYLIGLVARMDPVKGYPEFLAAAARLARMQPQARFVMVGDGSESTRRRYQLLARELGLDERVIWAGERRDMAAVLSALDLSVSASYSEGFSNVIAESMACGVPCVVTAVGDSARIVGDVGWLVEPHNATSLAEGISMAMEAHRAGQVNASRVSERIRREFSVEKMSERTTVALGSLRYGEGGRVINVE